MVTLSKRIVHSVVLGRGCPFINHNPLPFFIWKGVILLVKVFVRKNNVEQAIRVLRKKIQKEGILKRVRQTRYFESPSEKRIRKEKEGRKNYLKKKRKLEKLGVL